MANKETEEQKAQREMIEGIADNISELAEAVKKLLNGRLKNKAIYILLAKSSKMTPTQVEQVLDAVQNLEKDWVNK